MKKTTKALISFMFLILVVTGLIALGIRCVKVDLIGLAVGSFVLSGVIFILVTTVIIIGIVNPELLKKLDGELNKNKNNKTTRRNEKKWKQFEKERKEFFNLGKNNKNVIDDLEFDEINDMLDEN